MPGTEGNDQNKNGTGTQGANDQNKNDDKGTQSTFKTFEEALATLPREVQTLYDDHVKGLKSTVSATRQERDDLAKQLREAAKKAGDGSELQKKLTETVTQLEESNSRASFYEEAQSRECKNPKAAYAVMVANNLTTRQGLPDWEGIKKVAPELFGEVIGDAHAGSGTNNQQHSSNPHAAINNFIRNKGNPNP